MRIAYIQPIGGASGDMMLGALTDLGMPIEHLEAELGKLNVDGYRLEARQETRCEMRGTYLKVDLEDKTRYSPKQLLEAVDGSSLSESVKERSREVLNALWTGHAERRRWVDARALNSLLATVGSHLHGCHSLLVVAGNLVDQLLLLFQHLGEERSRAESSNLQRQTNKQTNKNSVSV